MSSAKLHVFSEGGLHMALLVAVLAIFAGVLIQDLFLSAEGQGIVLTTLSSASTQGQSPPPR
ncbi:hypothetical protein [Roseateles sp. PN1]|uniref:hypothetical protein n=1 Tax=Roseateles sp. PN1 TaxID=3137372 RepID=UPI001DC94BDC|nr:hypothetical protein [Burkholderiaceae bacterium]